VLAFSLVCLFGERLVPAESLVLCGHTGWTQALHFSPDGRTLFASSYNSVARWELDTGSRQAQGLLDFGVCGCSAIARDGSIVALEHPDSTVTLYDGCTNLSRTVISQPPGSLFTLAFSRDASTLATASSEGVRLWDTTSGRLHAELPLHRYRVTCLQFGPDGRTLAVGDWDGEIRLFDLGTWRTQLTIKAHSGPVTILAFTDDGSLMASLRKGEGVALWDAKTGRPRAGLAVIPGAPCSMAVSPTGAAIAVGFYDGPVRVWDAKKGLVWTALRANDGAISALAFSPDGRTLACGGFETVRLCTLRDDER
jgi:WD40 repeat protein